MKISCPSCQSSYKIADDKVQGRTVKVRCRKCGLTIHVNEQGVMAAASEAQAGPPDGGGGSQYSVLVSEGNQRDMSLAEIVASYNSGVITADTYVWAEGQTDWMPLREVPAIIEAVNTGGGMAGQAQYGSADQASQPQFPTSEPTTVDPPLGMQNYGAGAIPAPAPYYGSAASQQASSPVFGGGAPAAVQTSHAKMPDLFGTQINSVRDSIADEDSIVAFSPRIKPAKEGIAARDESSVLFSLSALTSAAAAVAPSTESKSNTEDSGLIDLGALADPGGAKQAAFGAPVGGILDSAPLLGAPLMDPSLSQLKVEEPPPKKNNTPLIAGIVIGLTGIVAAAAAIVVFVTQPPPPPPPPPQVVVTVTAPPASTPAPIPTPAASASAEAAAPPTGAPSATAPTTPKVAGPLPKKQPAAGAGAKETAPPPPPATTTAKPASTSKCGCPPGDLACAMACSVK
ncbi:MAG: zinc-ribbon domain-containing protein [Polyangiaceae bacterium]|nr:zinc-ribbon domain-containing protein [Polyangiaceae bacterium]